MPRDLSTEADPLTRSDIAFRWPFYADELRVCVNHFTNLEGLSLSKFGGISELAARRGCEGNPASPSPRVGASAALREGDPLSISGPSK